MDFDKHLFISYAHLDNQPLPSEQQGWITRFHVLSRGIPEHATRRENRDLEGRETARE